MIPIDYVAGIFDGEGNIGFQMAKKRRQPSSIRCRLGMKCSIVPELLRIQFGGRITRYKKSGMIQWDVTGPEAYSFLREVDSHLIIKRPQAILAMEYHLKLHKPGIKLSECERESRWTDFQEMKRLNRAQYEETTQ